jgi:ABC-type phosphate transport system substrate-binding protein
VLIKTFIASLLLLVSCIFSINKAHGVVVITNESAQINSLTRVQLRRIYSMRVMHWPNGYPIVVYVLPSDHKLHLQFSKESLQIFPYQLDRIWNKLTFSGLGSAPVLVDTPQTLMEAVFKTPGSIGYMDDSHIKEGIDVVKVSS